jgi:hypothetical protein
MKKVLKNKRTGFLYLGIILVSITSLGLFMQSCSKEDYFSDENEYLDESNSSSIHLETINAIQSQDLQTVLETVFQAVEKIEEKCHTYINVCDGVVTAIRAETSIEGTGSSKHLVRLKSANSETVANGWTYLGEVNEGVTGTFDAIKLYNKYKEEWNYSCLEMRLESEKRPGSNKYYMNVYVRQCS